MKPGLGTQLRHLIELLDGAVEQAYVEAGLDYRPRYTPVMRVLAEQPSATIGELAALGGLTQPAATQTVALMVKKGLLTVDAGGEDGRQRVVRLSAAGAALLPRCGCAGRRPNPRPTASMRNWRFPCPTALHRRSPYSRRVPSAHAFAMAGCAWIPALTQTRQHLTSNLNDAATHTFHTTIKRFAVQLGGMYVR